MLKRLKTGDVLVLPELSRIGRSLIQIFAVLNICMERGVKIIAIKEHYELGNTLEAKVLAFAFAIASEIERNLISIRTKEALARKRAEGMVLGRQKDKYLKLNGMEADIQTLLAEGLTKVEICKRLSICRTTLYNFINRKGLL